MPERHPMYTSPIPMYCQDTYSTIINVIMASISSILDPLFFSAPCPCLIQSLIAHLASWPYPVLPFPTRVVFFCLSLPKNKI